MVNLYKPAFVELKEYGFEINDSNFQYFLTAKKCCLIPMYFHKDETKWYINTEGLDIFMHYCRVQRKTDYSGEDLILLSEISSELDNYCPFNFSELGGLFMLEALQGIITKSGIHKRKKQIYVRSYWALKTFQEAFYNKYQKDFEAIGDKIIH
jgi:hypothetical protein